MYMYVALAEVTMHMSATLNKNNTDNRPQWLSEWSKYFSMLYPLYPLHTDSI